MNNPKDRPLEDRLRDALQHDLTQAPVSEQDLVQGARSQAGRIRRRRALAGPAAIAATVAVVAVAPTALRGFDGSSPTTAAASPSATTTALPTTPANPTTNQTGPAVTITPTRSGTAGPSAPTSTPTGPTSTQTGPTVTVTASAPTHPISAGTIPGSLRLSATELGMPMVLMTDIPGGRTPTVMSQECGSAGAEKLALQQDSRQWGWAQENSNNLQQTTVDQVVTLWPDSRAALHDVFINKGGCRFDSFMKLGSGAVTDQRYLATTMSSTGMPIAVGAVAVGPAVVSITVTGPQGSNPKTLLPQAEKLLRLAQLRAARVW